MQKRCFYQIDILSPSPILYVFKEKRRPTYLGAILTILMILFTLIFSVQLFVKWCLHKNYYVGYNKISLNESNSFDFNDGVFAFNSEILENELKDKYIFKIFLANNNGDLNEVKYEKCDLFNLKYNINFDKNNYNCIGRNNKITLSNYLNEKETYLTFQIIKQNLTYESTINKIPFNFIFSIPKIEHSNFKHPINIQKLSIQFKLSTEYYTHIENYYKTIEYETNSGIISSNSKSLYFAFFDESLTIKEISNKILKTNDTKIGEINFHLNLVNIDKYSRTYPTILDILSQIGGITSIFFQGTRVFMSIFASTKNNYVIFSHIVNKHNENLKQEQMKRNINFNQNINDFNSDSDVSIPRKKILDEKSFTINKSIYSSEKMINFNSIDSKNNSNFIKSVTHNNVKKKKFFRKILTNNNIIEGGILQKISLCNSFLIQIFPFNTKNKKILNMSEDFMRDCLGIENIIKTYLRMNQIIKLLNSDRRRKVDEMDYKIIENIKKIEKDEEIKEEKIQNEKKKKEKPNK